MLNINKIDNGAELTVMLEGRLDTMTAPQLEADMADCLENVSELVIDMTGLEYISSAGLRVLLSLQKTMNKKGSMVVRNATEEVMEIFEVTGFSEILTIE